MRASYSHHYRRMVPELLDILDFRSNKDIASQKLYRPEAGNPSDYEHLQPILTRTIDWDLIRNQYDEMVKYATALRLGTAETEAILQRFTRNNLQHPTYWALAELGRAIKTIFLCQYLEQEISMLALHLLQISMVYINTL
jgi:TnpA family transposase